MGFGVVPNGDGASEVFVDRVERELDDGELVGTGRFFGLSRVPDLPGLGTILTLQQEEVPLTGG